MDEQLCTCGKRPKRQCPGDEVKVALLRVYYVYQASGQEAPLHVVQGWWCLQNGIDVESLTADSIMKMICEPDQPTAQHPMAPEYAARRGKEGNSDDDLPKEICEATATYVTDRIDQALGGTRLDDQLWASSSNFVPGAAAEILDRINTGIDTIVSDAMKRFIPAGEPSYPAAVMSGIGAKLVLAPISRPIAQAKETIEVVGLFIAVLTLQPALAVACAKAIVHDEITSLIEKAIVEAISPVAEPNAVEDGSGAEATAMSKKPRQANETPGEALESLLKSLSEKRTEPPKKRNGITPV